MAELPKGIPQPLDLIFTWGRSSKTDNLVDLVVEEAIEGVTGGPSHVRLYLGQGRLWEFTLPECRYGTLDEIDLRKFDIEVGYHIMAVDLAVERVLIIHEEAERLIGTKGTAQCGPADRGGAVFHLRNSRGPQGRHHAAGPGDRIKGG